MPERIAIFGGSFNPPHLSHLEAVKTLAASNRFDEVIVVPCGPRPDKATTNDIEPIHRAAMADMTFGDIANVRVDLFDLEKDCFTRTRQLETRYGAYGDLWHVIGTDLIAGGAYGQSQIHRIWENPERTWNELKFAVLERPGYTCDAVDYPPQSIRVESTFVGASSDIRDMVFRREDISRHVLPRVGQYIDRYNLYRGVAPPRKTSLAIHSPRMYLEIDGKNLLAHRLAEQLESFAVDDINEANCIVPIGGDGTMLGAITRFARHRLPFVGINAGHRGYLLNEPEVLENPEAFFSNLAVYHLSQLAVAMSRMNGSVVNACAFNDAWVERCSLQSAWLKLTVNDKVRIPKMIADGVLVATPQGSTAYARAMGAKTLDTESGELVVVGNNIAFPIDYRLAVQHRFSSRVTIESLDPIKRSVAAVVDGIGHGIVQAMTVTASRSSSVELAFAPSKDMSEKRAADAYP